MNGSHSRWIEAAHSGQLPPLVPSFLAVFGGRQIGAAQNGGGGSCFSQKQVRNACLSALRTRFLAHLSFRGRQWSFMNDLGLKQFQLLSGRVGLLRFAAIEKFDVAKLLVGDADDTDFAELGKE